MTSTLAALLRQMIQSIAMHKHTVSPGILAKLSHAVLHWQACLIEGYLGILQENVTGGNSADLVDTWHVRNPPTRQPPAPSALATSASLSDSRKFRPDDDEEPQHSDCHCLPRRASLFTVNEWYTVTWCIAPSHTLMATAAGGHRLHGGAGGDHRGLLVERQHRAEDKITSQNQLFWQQVGRIHSSHKCFNSCCWLLR